MFLSENLDLLAGNALPIELQLVFQVGETAIFRNFFLQMLDWARDVENLHRATVATDQKILMITAPQTIMSCAAVKSDATDNSLFFEPLYKSIDRCRIGSHCKLRTVRDFLQGDRPGGLNKSREA